MCNIYETISVRSVIGILNKAHKNLKFFILHVCGVLYVMQENSDLWKLKCMFFFLNFQTQAEKCSYSSSGLGIFFFNSIKNMAFSDC